MTVKTAQKWAKSPKGVQKGRKGAPKRPPNGVKTTPRGPHMMAKQCQNDHWVTPKWPRIDPIKSWWRQRGTEKAQHRLQSKIHCNRPTCSFCPDTADWPFWNPFFLARKSAKPCIRKNNSKTVKNSLFGHLMHSIASLSPRLRYRI